MKDRARPGPARLAALDVVMRTLDGEFLAPTLRSVLDTSGLEGIERSQVTDLAYGALRRLQQVDAHLAPGLKQPAKLPPRVLAALRLGVVDLLYRHTPAHAAVSEWVEVVKSEAPGLAPLANAVLRGVERRAARRSAGHDVGRGDDAAPSPRALDTVTDLVTDPVTGPVTDLAGLVSDPVSLFSLPPWLWQELLAALGPTAAAVAARGMLEPEPLWLTAFSVDAVTALLTDGCDVAAPRPGALYPVSVRVRSPLPLDRLSAYRDGSIQPQNPTSLQAALLLGATSGQTVYDLASGRGIKSAVLAASGAHVTGVELVKRRMRAASANLHRLHLAVTHVAADLVTTDPAVLLTAIAEANGWRVPRMADAVLLDAPCSGTGTLRGHPEIKLRLNAADVADLAATQTAMLDNAAALVTAGGTLVYAVCALTNAEGPDVVTGFLARHGDFAAESVVTDLPTIAAGPGVFVVPEDGLDGFYLARLRRTDRPQHAELP